MRRILVFLPFLFILGCKFSTDSLKKPNIIFIITDDQFYNSFGFLEGEALTPNIDRFAGEGMYFSKAYVASSVFTPSRYTCLSGKYSSMCQSPRFLADVSEEGVPKIAWNMDLEAEIPNVAKVLKSNGYRTGFVGKWHVGGISDDFELVPAGSDPSDPEIDGILKAKQQRYCKRIQERYGFDFAGAVYNRNPDDDRALVDKVDELGIADNTLLIDFNDNGVETHSKGSCYEGGIHVPVMFRWPGKIEPGVNDEFISNIDFVPTIFEICGAEKPDDMELSGTSLVPLLHGEIPTDWRTSVYSEIGFTRSVNTKDWKYIAFKVPPCSRGSLD